MSTDPDPARDSGSLLAAVILLALGCLWGGGTSIARYVGTHGVAPLGYALWMTFGAGCVLLGVCRLLGRPVPLERHHLRYYLVCGLIGSALPTSNMLFVLTKIPAGIMAITLATTPVITYFLALALRLEKLDRRRTIGLVGGLVGALLMVLPGANDAGIALSGFVALAFLTPGLYACTNIYASRYRPVSGDSLTLATGMLLAASLMLLPATLASGSFHPIWESVTLAELLIVAHIVLASVAFFLYFALMRLTGPVYVSQVAYVVTATGIGWGMWVFGERHEGPIWLAVGCISIGVWLVNGRRKTPRAIGARG